MIQFKRALILATFLNLVFAAASFAQHYEETDLVSDIPGAAVTDLNLVNPWGLTRSSTSPWWVSDNGTGLSTLYNDQGQIVPLVVTIPGPTAGTTGTPTGAVFNGTTDFQSRSAAAHEQHLGLTNFNLFQNYYLKVGTFHFYHCLTK